MRLCRYYYGTKYPSSPLDRLIGQWLLIRRLGNIMGAIGMANKMLNCTRIMYANSKVIHDFIYVHLLIPPLIIIVLANQFSTWTLSCI